MIGAAECDTFVGYTEFAKQLEHYDGEDVEAALALKKKNRVEQMKRRKDKLNQLSDPI